MNICMVTNTYLPHVGGVARSVATFAEDLRNEGHRVLIVAPTFPDHEEHDRFEVDIVRLPAIQQFNGSDFSVRIPRPFLVHEKIDAFRPDLVHSHHPYLLGDGALRIARRRDLPLIFTHHTLYEEYTHYISNNPEKMKRFALFLSTNYANLCNQVVAPSKSIEHLITERGVTVPITEIPTGVDTDFFSKGDGAAFRMHHSIPEDCFVIGHLGRLAPEKNLDYLSKAAARTMARRTDTCFLVVGDGSSRKAIGRTFEKAGLADRLFLVGKKSGRELADAYHAMDLFAFASRTETQGMVLAEAMAAGLPVVALDAPGVREVVIDGTNGRLLDADASADRFAAVLVRAIDSAEQRDRWASAARKQAADFSRQRSARKMIRLYRRAIEEHRSVQKDNPVHLEGWNKFLLACRAEWELITEKTESLAMAIDEKNGTVGVEVTR